MTQEVPRRGGVLRVAVAEAPATLDPWVGPGAADRPVVEQLYSGLTRLDVDGDPHPDLAEAFGAAPDGQALTFRLRRGLAFHDGRPVHAEDVVRSLDRVRQRGRDYPYWAWIEPISRIQAQDSRTVHLELSRVSAALPVWLAFAGLAIASDDAQGSGLASRAPAAGTGPFRWAGQPSPDVIRLERNDAYHLSAKPYVDVLEFHVIPNAADRAAALRSGQIEFADRIAPEDWAGLTSDPDARTTRVIDARFHWLMLNTSVAPFDSRLVRQAIAHAVDRAAIARIAFAGHAEPILGGWVPPWNWAAAKDLPEFAASGDVARARGLLAEAGMAGGFRTQITVGTGVPAAAAQAAVVAESLARVGINADVVELDQPRYLDVVWRRRQYEISVMCWASPLNDPDDFVGGQFRWDRRNNVEQYAPTELSDRINRALEVPDRVSRRGLYREIQADALIECPRIPTVFPEALRAHAARLRGYVPLRNGSLVSLSDAWLED